GRNGRGPSDERGRDASLLGISDSELLGIIDDLADENGWVTILDLRLQLGENVERVRHSGVGSRVAWMRRYGWLERDEVGAHRLTAMGHAILVNPELSKTVESALERLNPAQRVRLTREIAAGAQGAPDELWAAIRREWQRSSGVRRFR
ncbi:MAG: hypothetical protein L3J91_06235, partial [Thermoplasmata archaeon]|nr:hypothetical protein [Thermoplasmata archaeon]